MAVSTYLITDDMPVASPSPNAIPCPNVLTPTLCKALPEACSHISAKVVHYFYKTITTSPCTGAQFLPVCIKGAGSTTFPIAISLVYTSGNCDSTRGSGEQRSAEGQPTKNAPPHHFGRVKCKRSRTQNRTKAAQNRTKVAQQKGIKRSRRTVSETKRAR